MTPTKCFSKKKVTALLPEWLKVPGIITKIEQNKSVKTMCLKILHLTVGFVTLGHK